MFNIDFIGLLLLFIGFIIGLGAVTVIDIHGFLGRKSHYWTESTIRSHKITKPMIWVGIFLVVVGEIIFFRNKEFVGIPQYLFFTTILLIINGIFLSFWVSPFLLAREREGKARELLPPLWQKKITISFLISFMGWWSSVVCLAYYLTK